MERTASHFVRLKDAPLFRIMEVLDMIISEFENFAFTIVLCPTGVSDLYTLESAFFINPHG